MEQSLFEVVRGRRSRYSIGNKLPVSDDKLLEIVNEANLYVPTSFNSQSARTVILINENHSKFWKMVENAIKAVTDDAGFKASKLKLDGFSAGYGTVLFYEDMDVVKSLQDQYVAYAKNFPVWSMQSNGMLEYLIWLAFSKENIGATLQHYSELVEQHVAKEFKIKSSWKLVAQMPFGNIVNEAGKKEFADIKDRVILIK